MAELTGSGAFSNCNSVILGSLLPMESHLLIQAIPASELRHAYPSLRLRVESRSAFDPGTGWGVCELHLPGTQK